MKPARELWSKDDAPTPEVTMEEIITRAERLRRNVRFSNALELVAGVFVVVVFVAMAAVPGLTRLPALSRVGAALIACATIFVLTYLFLRSQRPEPRRDASTVASYREDLRRRHALLVSVTKWYLAPFWPGGILFFLGIFLDHFGEPAAMRSVGLSFMIAASINVGIWLVNRRAAKKLAAELAALPAADE
jgi:threonine/homoserine/homoserine lactone efflux protein